ncbi:hypothetical protein Avbf_08089 [Armadillidium vulgare]|nr:hypothetical protein Avbf_08089 [Armadillidium vulgare]
MLIGSALVTTVGCAQIGGIVNVLNISSKGGRLDVFDLNCKPFDEALFRIPFYLDFLAMELYTGQSKSISKELCQQLNL